MIEMIILGGAFLAVVSGVWIAAWRQRREERARLRERDRGYRQEFAAW